VDVVHTCDGVFFSFLTSARMWMNLEDVMLSEINQSQKDKYRMIPFIGVRYLE